MKKLGKTMAVLLSLVMMGTMPGAVSSIKAYGATTSESEDTATLAAASGLGVESHTQEEIIKHIKDSGAVHSSQMTQCIRRIIRPNSLIVQVCWTSRRSTAVSRCSTISDT